LIDEIPCDPQPHACSHRVLIAATNELPEVAEQAESQQLAVITPDGLRLPAAYTAHR
jgi:hypothetical protein